MRRNLILLCLIEGLLSSSHMTFFFLYLQTYQLDVLSYSIMENLVTSMVFLHPLYGYVTDRYPLFGSRKRSYLVLTGLVGSLGYCVIGLTWWFVLPFWSVVALQFAIDVSNSVRVVVVEAINVSIHNFRNAEVKSLEQLSTNSSLMTVFGARLIGKILSNALFGAAYYYFRNSFFFFNAAVTLCSVVIAMFTVDLPSPPAKQRPGLLASVRISLATIKKMNLQRLIVSDFVVSLSPSVEVGLKYFLISVLQFSNTDFSLRTLVSEACFLLGILAMGTLLKEVKRSVFLKTVFVLIAFWNLSLIFIVNHHKNFFISPFAMMLIYSGGFALLVEMKILPLMGVFMENCPPSLEGFFISWIHLFSSVAKHLSGAIGSYLLFFFGISSTNFENLGSFILIRFAVYLAGVLLLLTATIPEKKSRRQALEESQRISMVEFSQRTGTVMGPDDLEVIQERGEEEEKDGKSGIDGNIQTLKS